MSFDQITPNQSTDLLDVGNATEQTEMQKPNFDMPVPLNEMLQNKELLTCYKCKETFTQDDEQQQQHSLDSNNIILGIILNKKTPSSICLKCLSLKMMEVITEQFTKNSKDYTGMFFSYEQKFKA